MADREDEIMESLAHTISFIYTILVDVCGALPVRIGLPTDQHIPAREAVPAIQRVAQVAHDQPMGELQTMQLFTGCIHLLAAIDLYALCATRYEDTRAEGAGLNLILAEQTLKSLALWLVINEAD
ncbi:hypothetical protein ACFY3G_17765 [Streptomyces phaeochromogenes]|uniref:hypothetical protein n=1 Tax=Streptomyces phaeochromogenes TaxID=1923 RepID=UPI00368A9A05